MEPVVQRIFMAVTLSSFVAGMVLAILTFRYYLTHDIRGVRDDLMGRKRQRTVMGRLATSSAQLMLATTPEAPGLVSISSNGIPANEDELVTSVDDGRASRSEDEIATSISRRVSSADFVVTTNLCVTNATWSIPVEGSADV